MTSAWLTSLLATAVSASSPTMASTRSPDANGDDGTPPTHTTTRHDRTPLPMDDQQLHQPARRQYSPARPRRRTRRSALPRSPHHRHLASHAEPAGLSHQATTIPIGTNKTRRKRHVNEPDLATRNGWGSPAYRDQSTQVSVSNSTCSACRYSPYESSTPPPENSSATSPSTPPAITNPPANPQGQSKNKTDRTPMKVRSVWDVSRHHISGGDRI